MKIGRLGFGLADWGGGRDMLRQCIAELTTVEASCGLENTVLLQDTASEWQVDCACSEGGLEPQISVQL